MVTARFKDLVLDAADAERVGHFWAAALHREWHAQPGGDGYLTGATPQHTVWINQVTEPKAAKYRVHLDIYTETLSELTSLGASVVEEFPRWTVMTDPEGGEFCAFLRDQVPTERLHGLVVDSRAPDTIAAWWADVYGARLVVNDGWVTLEDVPGMPIPTMDFVPVPELKTPKNRIHWDVTGDTNALVARGAKLLRPRDDEIGWDVLADPEGNEFCAFSPSP